MNDDPQKTVNEMNNFFIGVGQRLTKDIPAVYSDNFEELDRSMLLKKMTETETREIIKALKNKYSSGYDEISNNIIKQTAEEITTQLNHIINNSFRYGIFPDKLKIAVVKPVHKKGDINDYNNYRPISILPSFSKILEMAYCRRIMEYFIENNIFRQSQHGYLKGKSIKTAIFQFITKIVEAFENKELAMGMFLDLSKAYDCLDSDNLLRKLERYGIRGPALEWVKSYFSFRKQMVEVEMDEETVRSTIQDIILGIPQGSIAGPLFFIIYINDYGLNIDTEHRKVTTVNYVDDVNKLIIERLLMELKQLCERILETSNTWFESNNLIINKEKTQLILFTPTNSKTEEINDICMNQEKFILSNSTKFLGIFIDKHLNWKEHINSLCDKVITSIYGFRIISNYIRNTYLKTVYHATIEAKLRFGIIFYGAGNINPLFVAQKRAIRILNNMKYDQSCRNIFKKIGILTIYAIYIQECVLFIKNNPVLFEKYENKKNFYETRNQDYLYPKLNLTISQRQTEYRCLKLYNSLPIHIKIIEDKNVFKKNLFKYLLDLEPYTLEEFLSHH